MQFRLEEARCHTCHIGAHLSIIQHVVAIVHHRGLLNIIDLASWQLACDGYPDVWSKYRVVTSGCERAVSTGSTHTP